MPSRCVVCGKPTEHKAGGGYRKTCSDTCLKRLKSRRARKNRRSAPRTRVGATTPAVAEPVERSKLRSSISAALAILRVLVVPLAVLGLLGYCGYMLFSGPSVTDPGLTPERRNVVEDARRFAERVDAYTLVTWTYSDTMCADGWRSPSIGEQGACSHHGGVVSLWKGSDGSEVRCADNSPPRTKVEQLDQLDRFGRFHC